MLDPMSQRERRSYDHRVKAHIIASGDPTLFAQLDIPRSTAATWIRRGVGNVVAFENDRLSEWHSERIAKLERRIDATVIRLLDGTRAYLHAVIDNYSRRILGWTVAERLNPMNTCSVLQ